MKGRFNYTKEERVKAREFFDKYYGLGFINASREKLEEMVGVFYDSVQEVPLNKIDKKQLYCIAGELYRRSEDIVKKFGKDEYEESVLKNLGVMKRAKNEETYEKYDERVCIQIEPLEETHYLVKKYYALKDGGEFGENYFLQKEKELETFLKAPLKFPK